MLRRLFIAFFGCLIATHAWAGVALVSGQIYSNYASPSATLVLTLPNNPTTGNFVVVGVIDGASSTISVADANSNSYTATTGSPFAGSGAGIGIYYLANAPSNASKTITITVGSASAGVLGWVAEFSGVATSSPQEQTPQTSYYAGPGTAINLPSITTTHNGDLLISIVNTSAITSANSPWTAMGSIIFGNLTEYDIQATAGAQATNFTSSASNHWDGMIASFVASGGSTPAVVHSLLTQGVGN
jgi:hypothetical protein